MQMNEYQALAARTIKPEMGEVAMESHALHGIASEVGEIHGIFQKFYQGHDVDTEHVKKEFGDLLWFIAEFCTSQGWTLEEVAQGNIDKLIARYPDGFDPEKSLHRKAGDV